MSIKIVALSDLHGYLPEIETPADIMIIAGDIVPFEIQFNKCQSKKWFENDFASWIKELPVDEVFAVAGNHDAYLESINQINLGLLRQATNFKLKYLKNNWLNYVAMNGESIKIFGTPYCSIYGTWPFMRPDESLAKKYEKIPEDVDVIISHDPPFAISDADVILDDIRRKGMMAHLGNKPLSEKIKDINFDILFCGHIHSGDHNLVNKIVNVSIRNEQMAPTYSPFYYEINKQ